jgi:hypothetical protein
VIKNSARVGAAAFALGVALAGPQATAEADSSDGDSRTATARQDDTQQRSEMGSPRRGAKRTAAPAPEAAELDAASAVKRIDDDRVKVDINPDFSDGEVISPAPDKPAFAPTTEESAAGGRPAPAAATPDRRGSGQSPVQVSVAGSAKAAAAPDPVTVDPEPVLNDLPLVSVPATGAGPDPIIAETAAAAVKGAKPAAAGPAEAAPIRLAAPITAAAVAQRATPPVMQALNTAVNEWFDSTATWLADLPTSPIRDVISGGLLLVRRTLFNQLATAVPDKYLTTPNGQFFGTVGAVDPEGDALTYSLAQAPQYGTVGIAADGTYTYTPGPDYAGADVFTVAVTSPGFNLLAPFSSRQTLVTVKVPCARGGSGPGAAAASASGPGCGSGTAPLIDDGRVKIGVNPNFAYGDALLAAIFSDLAYNHRDDADFTSRVQGTGWEGIGVSGPSVGAGGFSPSAGGYGVRDGLALQSYAFAGKRTAADGTQQFVVAFEGSANPLDEPADWIANAGQYGWSRYYASLEPLMSEVVRQMIEAQRDDAKTQLILTGHSLGGATAMMAFADFLAPEGNLWPGTTDVLAAGGRVLDAVDGWASDIRTALLAATTVYTFGAPSILIEPTKPGLADAAAFAATAAASGPLAALALLPGAISALIVDDKKLPDLRGVAGITFGTRVFQFEHANTSWLPPYPGDIVAQIGSRDPGTVLQINLDNSIHTAYTGLVARFVPGATHFMDRYRESITRLVTNNRILKSPNDLSGSSPQLPKTLPGQGSDTRNDFFVNTSDDGGAGNDLFVFSTAGSYSANGRGGSDAYSISSYDVALLIDGADQSGRDTVVFDLAGTPGVSYSRSAPDLQRNDIAVFSVTGTNGKSSSVTVRGWDQWQISDVLQVIKPADGRWTLDVWTDIERDPAVVVGPAEQIPLSVV